MTPQKRAFDLALALVCILLLLLPVLFIAALLLLVQGRPIFFLSERMHSPDQRFLLWKFRTMRVVRNDFGVSGGDKRGRITAIGRVLRRTRLDEAPQLWNILRGDLSFVGPRPPLPIYVSRYPELYARVLQNRPGLTGLATAVFHKREEELLAGAATSRETDAIYMRRCIPRKARLDMIYARRTTVRLDILILLQTVSRIFGRAGSA